MPMLMNCLCWENQYNQACWQRLSFRVGKNNNHYQSHWRTIFNRKLFYRFPIGLLSSIYARAANVLAAPWFVESSLQFADFRNPQSESSGRRWVSCLQATSFHWHTCTTCLYIIRTTWSWPWRDIWDSWSYQQPHGNTAGAACFRHVYCMHYAYCIWIGGSMGARIGSPSLSD